VKLDILDVLKRLPHRYPLLLVDRASRLERDKRIVALKNVTFNEASFQGHFPLRPVMPGVFPLEALAKAAALLVLVSFVSSDDNQSLFCFGGSDAARFRRLVVPGDQLTLDVRLVRHCAGVFEFRASGHVGQQLAVKAELLGVRGEPA
jgi:3-hydroxyacyl-[acyl-carrier-protein] dehydratase